MKVAAFALLLAVVLFGAVTLAVLEGPEVVVVRTTDPTGHVRTTRTWIVDDGTAAWIEAANPERDFYRHILVHPDIDIERHGELRHVHAVPMANPEGHQLIRRLLSEKYGFADCWIGLIADTSRSLAIRLEPR